VAAENSRWNERPGKRWEEACCIVEVKVINSLCSALKILHKRVVMAHVVDRSQSFIGYTQPVSDCEWQ